MSFSYIGQPRPTILLIGASRGLGHAMAAEFLKKGWNVVGTVRGGGSRTLLHDLADEFRGRVEIEILDMQAPLRPIPPDTLARSGYVWADHGLGVAVIGAKDAVSLRALTDDVRLALDQCL